MKLYPAFKGEFQTATDGTGTAFLRLEGEDNLVMWYKSTYDGWQFLGNSLSDEMDLKLKEEQ